MALTNLSQVLVRNIDELEANNAVLVNFPVDELHHEWLAAYPNTKLHYFTNNKLAANQLSTVNQSNISTSFGAFLNKQHTQFDLAVIAFPKSKAELAYSLAMLAPQLTQEAQILFVGENKGGIKSVAKLSQDYVAHCTKLDSARHCSLYAGQLIKNNYTFNLDDWFHYYPLAVNGIELTIAALPGVFSQKNLDKGTKVLLENLPQNYQGKVLDFGCGAGVISAYLGKVFPNLTLTGLDISALAVESTIKTLAINNLQGNALVSDGLAELDKSIRFDHVVTNPPFHQGLKTHYAATEQFLVQSPNYLTSQGSLTVVANSFLQYQPIMKKHFKQVNTTTNERGFCIYQCMK